MLPGVEEYESQGAEFDEPARVYRYSLHRMWGGGSLSEWKTTLWIMLNPSTADENELDPTLRRCEAFSRAWGFDGFEVVNLFAIRSTDPKMLYLVSEPVGQENDRFILQAAYRADKIIVGWGTEKIARERGKQVMHLLASGLHFHTWCLGTNDDGSPKHPLYIAKHTKLRRYT